jgi:hypothetical protein
MWGGIIGLFARLRTVMCSIMRGQRGLKSAISIGLSEGGGLQHLHPLSQEAIYPTSPRTPRQRLRSIPNINLQENRRRRPNFRQIQMHQFRRFLLPVKRFGIFHGRLSFVLGSNYHPCRQKYRGLVVPQNAIRASNSPINVPAGPVSSLQRFPDVRSFRSICVALS